MLLSLKKKKNNEEKKSLWILYKQEQKSIKHHKKINLQTLSKLESCKIQYQ